MKKRGFWEKFDGYFDFTIFCLLLGPNVVCLLLVIYFGWPTPYTEKKPGEFQLSFEHYNDQLIDEFVRPKIEAKYNVKTLRAKTNTMDDSVGVRIETNGTGRYEEIAEDVLRLAPIIFGSRNDIWSREPIIEDDGTPKSPHPGWIGRQMKYILAFDHDSDDGGITVFFANEHKYPEWSTPWHSHDLYNSH
ncbi:MAG: hypothetical protein IKQ16_00715 [Lentisphaeria bacterium]|nr:hypothetical protein [Lentisphaeria bacterium]